MPIIRERFSTGYIAEIMAVPPGRVACLSESDSEAGKEELRESPHEGRDPRGNAPQGNHQPHAPFPAPAVHQDGDGKGQHDNGPVHRGDERAGLAVGHVQVSLHDGEHCGNDLSVYVVEHIEKEEHHEKTRHSPLLRGADAGPCRHGSVSPGDAVLLVLHLYTAMFLPGILRGEQPVVRDPQQLLRGESGDFLENHDPDAQRHVRFPLVIRQRDLMLFHALSYLLDGLDNSVPGSPREQDDELLPSEPAQDVPGEDDSLDVHASHLHQGPVTRRAAPRVVDALEMVMTSCQAKVMSFFPVQPGRPVLLQVASPP